MSKLTYSLDGGAYPLQDGHMGAGAPLIDDFEDDDLSEWTIPSQTGTVQTSSREYHGAVSMQTKADGLTDAYAAEADLNAIPRPGDKWEFYVRFGTLENSSAQARFYFGRQSSGATDCYEIQLYNDGTFRIQKDIGNTDYGIGASATGISYQTDVWYRVRHWWMHADKSSDHVIELTDMSSNNQLAELSANDDRFYAGDIGVRMNDYAGGWWDWMRVVERT